MPGSIAPSRVGPVLREVGESGVVAQGTFRTRREATDGPVEVDVVAEAYLGQCGAFAENVRPKAAAAYEAVTLLKVGGALCDGWESRGCGLGVDGRRSGLLIRYPIADGPSSGGGRCCVPDDCVSNRVGWGGVVAW